MIPRENIKAGDRVKAYCLDVRREQRGQQIFLSRAHPKFMEKLFILEVPEIYDGLIEIKSSARDPGSRAKICVKAVDTSLDPVGACVIGYVNDELVVNPTYEELQNSKLNLTVAGTEDAIMMVESGSEFVSESLLLEALKLAQDVNGQIVRFINEIVADCGKDKWEVADEQDELVDIKTKINDSYSDDLRSVVKSEDNKTDK